MKSFKHIALTALMTAGSFGAVLYTSCNKDACKDVVCQNGGTCSDGKCTCATGYEGTNCETAMRAKFIKSWTASDKRVSDNQAVPTYIAPIVAGGSITEVKIGNFWGAFDHDVIATISNGTTITIASQQPDNDGYYVSGSGTLNATDGKITWSYTIKDPTNTEKAYSGTWQ